MAVKRITAAVVGATGLAGQQFLAALATHPRFEVTRLAASARSAGKLYRDALREASGQSRWYVPEPLDGRYAEMPVEDAAGLDARGLGVVFSAIEAEPARELEPRWAAFTPVVSTASAFRYEADVPVLVPGVNLDHARLIDTQRRVRGWNGFITPNPNCTTTGLVMTLAPLHQRWGLKRVYMTSLQACSGAGRSPGVIGLDIIDNVVPFIPKEEEKVEKETRKILGAFEGGAIGPAGFAISCTCTRVPVLEGHTESVFVELERPADEESVKAAWRAFGGEYLQGEGSSGRRLPSAPRRLIHVHDDPYRPQPRLDREVGDGMVTSVGRLRRDDAVAPGLGWKFVLVSHNTKMGAAKGAILVAEHLAEEGYIS